MLNINNLSVQIEEKKVLNNLNLEIKEASFHILMGANGSGKSSLAYTLMGHPKYKVIEGSITFDAQDITQMPVEKRARLGMLLACQHPQEVPGVKVITFLKEAHRIITGLDIELDHFKKIIYELLDIVKLDYNFAYRNLNEGFSGGEKKRLEILQLLLLKPKLAIIDEIDSGLDIDGIKVVADAIKYAKKLNEKMSVILITHYQKILNYLDSDYIHILSLGKIIRTGNIELSKIIESQGYNGSFLQS